MTIMQKLAVVTGGTTGIGLATVQTLLSAQFKVIAIGITDFEEPSKTDAEFMFCDLQNSAEIEAVFLQIKDKYQQLDCLINNAGILAYGSAVELSEALWDKVMAVNVKAPFLCAKYAIPFMATGGIIINVASVQSFVAQPNVAAYATSKAALLGLTRSIAIDFSPQLRCITVCPGTIDTPMLHKALNEASDPEAMLTELNNSHLSGRIGQPQEVAELIAFLCSDKCTFINGQEIRVDGGLGVNIGGSAN